MKLKTSELSGIALDYAVAVAEGVFLKNSDVVYGRYAFGNRNLYLSQNGYPENVIPYNPSANWAIAGPIIEQNKIDVDRGDIEAAMISYVALKLGCEVEVPDDLIKENNE